MLGRVVFLFFLFTSAGHADQKDVVERIARSAEILQELIEAPDRTIPEELLARAQAVAVIPSLAKGGFILGGQYGKGVVVARTPNGWSAPSFITLRGGTFGLQIGGQAVDLVLLIMNKQGVDKLVRSKFTLGGDASVAAGPVGRAASAETDALMTAKILAYSRSRGVFAGLTLQGTSIRQDRDAVKEFYGKQLSPRELLMENAVPSPPEAEPLVKILRQY